MNNRIMKRLSAFLLGVSLLLGNVPGTMAAKGQAVTPMETVLFKFPENGFSLGDGASITIENLLKLYDPGAPENPIKYTIDIPNQMDGHVLRIKLIETYGNQPVSMLHDGEPAEYVQYDGASLSGTIEDSIMVGQKGVFAFTVELTGPIYNQTGTVDIGVIPENSMASDDFIFGIHTILNRMYTYNPDPEKGREFGVIGIPRDSKDYGRYGFNLLLDYVDYSGVNLIRDGCGLNFDQDGSYAVMFNAGMEAIFKAIAPRGLQLDWPLLGIPYYAVEQMYKVDPVTKADVIANPHCYPPEEKFLTQSVQKLAAMADRFHCTENVIFEIWNEPNSQAFFRIEPLKTAAKQSADTEDDLYMKAYLDILKISTNALIGPTEELKNTMVRISNGGMVCWPVGHPPSMNGNMAYYTAYNDLAEADRLSHISIHPHGEINGLHEFYQGFLKDYIPEKNTKNIFLNESGSNDPDPFAQAMHTAGKSIWAKGHGCAGFVAFQMGAVSNDNYTNAKGQLDESEFRYRMITQELEPRPVFLAYMTVIKMLDGYTAAEIICEGYNDYAYLFRKEDPINGDSLIEVNIGTKRDAYLGDLDYQEYDMYGNIDGYVPGISYKVYAKSDVTVTYDANDNSNKTASETVKQGVDYITSIFPFDSDIDTFTGWNTSADGTGTQYAAGDIIKAIREHLTLYACRQEKDQPPKPIPSGDDSDSGNRQLDTGKTPPFTTSQTDICYPVSPNTKDNTYYGIGAVTLVSYILTVIMLYQRNSWLE